MFGEELMIVFDKLPIKLQRLGLDAFARPAHAPHRAGAAAVWIVLDLDYI